MYLGQLYRKVVKPQQMSVIMSKHICVNRYAMSLTFQVVMLLYPNEQND